MFKYKKIRKYSSKSCDKVKPLHQQTLLLKSSNGQRWAFTNKLGDNASVPRVDPDGGRVDWGFPKISQVIYPGQTIRIDAGWQASQLKDNTMIHTVPHALLLDANLVGIPQILTKQGSSLTQTLLNNNDFPIQIALKQDNTGVELRKINTNDLSYEVLQFDGLHLISSLLGVAEQVIPFFL